MTVIASFYEIVKWLHVSAVVVGFGSTFAYAVIIATAMRSHPRSMPGVLAGVAQNGRTIVSGGAVLVLVTGIYLAADGPWSFGDFFVTFGFIAIFVIMGMAGMVFAPTERRATELATRDVAGSGEGGDVKWSAEFEAANNKLSRAGMLAGLIIIVTIYVMVDKPFL